MWQKAFENNEMKIWSPGRSIDQAPDVIQPFDPSTGQPWGSEAAAQDWAEATIHSFENMPAAPEPEPEPEAPAEEDPNAIDA